MTPEPNTAAELLNLCPKAGSGVHRWLYGAACTLARANVAPQRIAELLEAHSKDCGRIVPGTEIVDTVRNAIREINGHEPGEGSALAPKRLFAWPDYDPQKAFRVASQYWDFSLEKWRRESAIAPGEVTTASALAASFQPGEFITVGFKKNYFETYLFSRKAIRSAHRLPYVVLS